MASTARVPSAPVAAQIPLTDKETIAQMAWDGHTTVSKIVAALIAKGLKSEKRRQKREEGRS